jgi:hypothetical protein
VPPCARLPAGEQVLPGAQGADLSGEHADRGARDGERAELA